jgi:acyl-CoA synthetase (AMP-forming)/AMP-acid ligase II
MSNLSYYLNESAEMHPHATALHCEGTTTSYPELRDAAARFASSLASRCARSTRPALRCLREPQGRSRSEGTTS